MPSVGEVTLTQYLSWIDLSHQALFLMPTDFIETMHLDNVIRR